METALQKTMLSWLKIIVSVSSDGDYRPENVRCDQLAGGEVDAGIL